MYRFFSAAARRASLPLVATFLFLAAATAACDNPVEEHHDEHSDAHGLILLANGSEILRVEGAAVDDTLFVPLGGNSSIIEVEFLTEEGEPIHAEDLDDDFGLRLTVADPTVADYEMEGDWSFVLNGLVQDTTSLVVELLHLEHPDFTTPDIPVVVR